MRQSAFSDVIPLQKEGTIRYPETKEVILEFLLLTKSEAFLIGPIATLLGYIMDFIYEVCSLVGVENIGLCIILFTIITNVLMLPLTIKQQRFTKLNAVMNPEIQAIQKKYKDRKDQVSMQKQQAETQAVYEKYGASPTAGCLPMLIQLPVMFALYRVIYNIPAYISDIKAVYAQVANKLLERFTSQEVIESCTDFVELAKSNALAVDKYDYTEVNRIIDLLYQFDSSEWAKLKEIFPTLSDVIDKTSAEVVNLNNFLGGINLMEAPGFKISIALIIPILAGLTQWISAKIMERENPNRSSSDDENENPMAKSMKSMNTIMPLMSVFLCITLPAGLGLYWIASSVVRTVIQLFVNHSMKNISIEDLIRKNVEKQNKKRAKQGLSPISADASIRTTQRAQEIMEKNAETERIRQEKLRELKAQGKLPETDLEKKNPGSIAAKARMVQQYNERTNGKK